MSAWACRLSFAIFYYAVYYDNTNGHQYENISILLDGVRLSSLRNAPPEYRRQDMASRYCRGDKAIAKSKAAELRGLPDRQLVQRISDTSITDVDLAASTMAALLQSDHLTLDNTTRRALLAMPYTEDPRSFLARLLRIAVDCPLNAVVKLSDEMIGDIMACRENGRVNMAGVTRDLHEPSRQNTILPTASGEDSNLHDGAATQVFSDGSFASYAIHQLQYPEDKEALREDYLALHDCTPVSPFSDDEMLECAERIARAEAAFVIEFEGSATDLTEVFLNHVSVEQCSLMAFVAVMRSEAEYRALRQPLTGCVRFGLEEHGKMFLAHGLNNNMPVRRYRFKLVYALTHVSEEQKKRWALIREPGLYPLIQRKRYEGNVPDFLLPVRISPEI